MNEERTGKCLRQVEHIRGQLWYRYSITVNQVVVVELEIKDTTDTDTSASYIDLHIEIDSEGRLRTNPYDKRDDFNFPIVNFPFICSNIR
jgi:hypothetical protein